MGGESKEGFCSIYSWCVMSMIYFVKKLVEEAVYKCFCSVVLVFPHYEYPATFLIQMLGRFDAIDAVVASHVFDD